MLSLNNTHANFYGLDFKAGKSIEQELVEMAAIFKVSGKVNVATPPDLGYLCSWNWFSMETNYACDSTWDCRDSEIISTKFELNGSELATIDVPKLPYHTNFLIVCDNLAYSSFITRV